MTDQIEAHFTEGNRLAQQGQLAEAVACYRQVLALKPDLPEAHHNLGLALTELGRLDEAIASLRTALRLRPHYPSAQNSLGNALQAQGWFDEAAACYRQALSLKPDHVEAHTNLGHALMELERLDQAEASTRRAIALRPDNPVMHNNLGLLLRRQGRLDEAIACLRQAIALRPDYPEAHVNLALALLAVGDLAAGWEEYEWRWRSPEMGEGRRDLPQPQWRGEEAAGRRLLIHAEQGFGDSLQFCRYAPLAAARGLRVILEVPRPLVRLLGRLPGVEQVVAAGDALPPFDLHCSMFSLPWALGTTMASIPAAPAYLQADDDEAARWKYRLEAMLGPGLRVGLVWAGNPRSSSAGPSAIDRRRSIAPERLAPLFAIPGLQFVSLQKDGPPAPEAFALTDVMAEMTDFADTAALIANLDLVISVDTAVAHLAAALGKPVWLLNRFDSCWRWFQLRPGSPQSSAWYPSLRQFRQPSAGDWDTVIAEVTAALRLAADSICPPGTSPESPHRPH